MPTGGHVARRFQWDRSSPATMHENNRRATGHHRVPRCFRAGDGGGVDAITIARRTARTIKTNLAWAFAYNIVTIPLAALGRLNPMLAATAMSLSSLLVAANSLRLLRGVRR